MKSNSKRNSQVTPATNGSSKSPSALPTPKILIHQFLQTMRMRNCSHRTIHSWRFVLNRFVSWCGERSLDCMSEITADHLAAYRRSLFHYRNPKTGAPLKFDTQAHYLMPVRRWFDWMKTQALIELDPSRDVELPKSEDRLPTSVFTAEEVETLLNVPDVNTRLGLRDRAILETFYSCGIRCGELVGLDVYDVNHEREILTIRRGKGGKDRVVPIGTRALSWVRKWTEDIRPDLVDDVYEQATNGRAHRTVSPDSGALFVSRNGRRLGPNHVSNLVKRYMTEIGIEYRGSCHLLRHTAATLMMEAGADLRSLQQFLGHARLNTTQIYTHVSIQRLQDVHRRTHPAKPNGKPSGDGKSNVDEKPQVDDHTQDDSSSRGSQT